MWRDPGPRQGWGEWLLGWLFTLLLLALITQALFEMIRPMLPWIGLVILLALPLTLIARRLWRGY